MEADADTLTPPQAQTANTTIPDMVQLEILRVIQYLEREMKELKKADQDSGNYEKKHGGNGERKPRVYRNTRKYCWSHGACAHKSVECIWKNLGHQDDATADEKKNGSTDHNI